MLGSLQQHLLFLQLWIDMGMAECQLLSRPMSNTYLPAMRYSCSNESLSIRSYKCNCFFVCLENQCLHHTKSCQLNRGIPVVQQDIHQSEVLKKCARTPINKKQINDITHRLYVTNMSHQRQEPNSQTQAG